MSVVKQFNDFIFFLILGVIISCIFDIFRTLRKVQKSNSIYVVMLQDIIFFLIVTLITTVYMIKVIDDRVRVYMFVAIGIGIAISRKVISKVLINIYSIVLFSVKGIFEFINLPLKLHFELICKIVKKIIKKCCKLFFVMVNLKCKLLSVFGKMSIFKRKRGLNNGSKSKYERKKSRKKKKEKS